MLEDKTRTDPLAHCVPDGFPEGAGALDPVVIGGAGGAWHLAPVAERVPIDHADGAVIQAELPLGLVGDDRDRSSARRPRNLKRHATEPAGGSQTRTTSPFSTILGGQPKSMRYA